MLLLASLTSCFPNFTTGMLKPHRHTVYNSLLIMKTYPKKKTISTHYKKRRLCKLRTRFWQGCNEIVYKPQPCHIRSSILYLALTALWQGCHSLVTVQIPRLSQCGDKVVINPVSNFVTTIYNLVFLCT